MASAPRRDPAPFILTLAFGAVVLFLLVGGMASVGRQSGPYHQTMNESFGAQTRLLVTQSNLVGAQLHTLVDRMATLGRPGLTSELGNVVSGAQSVASEADHLAAPPPPGEVGPNLVQAMDDRATAVRQMQSTIEGLLALAPTPSTSPTVSLAAQSVTVSEAVQNLTAVGRLLVGADQTYVAARREFAKVPGGSLLPRSVWVSAPVVWETGAVRTVVDQLSSSPSLAPLVDLQLTAVALTPAVLPPAPQVSGQPQAPALPAGTSEVPPTCSLSVTAVVRNAGTIEVMREPVQATVQPLSGGPPFYVKREVTLAPSQTVALALPKMPVTPTAVYTVIVSIGLPPGQSRVPPPQAATVAVASFGSANDNAVCARTPVAAP